MRRSLLLLALVGCHPAAPPPIVGGSPDPIGAPHDTLRAMLEHDIGAGQPVAIVGGSQGLRAISADGARTRVLVPGKVAWVEIDERGDALWYGTGDEVRVIDLEAPATAATTGTLAISGLPFARHDLVYDLAPHGARSPEDTAMYTMPDGPNEGITIMIAPHATELLSRGSIMFGMEDSNAKFAASVKAAKIVGQPLIEKLAARAAHRPEVSKYPPEDKSVRRVDGIDPKSCEQTSPSDCGLAEAIAGTHYWRVIVETACGDGCGRIYQLYDTDAKKLGDGDWGHAIVDAWVARDGSAFIADGRIFRFATGPVAATPTDDAGYGSGGGWLGGGTYYGR